MSGQLNYDGAQVPPPAPPLPPPTRYGQRAATAIAKLAQPFLSGGARSKVNTQRETRHHTPDENPHEMSSSSYLAARHEAVHKTGLPISAVDISPYRTHAILAGREILKTIRVENSNCTEEFNLRSRIIHYASTHDTNRDAMAAQHKDQLAASDVKWSHGNYDTTIATAAANGRIMIYDLNRPSVEMATLHEHTRQVHRIAFNPHQPAILLSASQDGTLRLWDLRALGGGESGGKSARTCRSMGRYTANSDGVRDVKWAPHDGYVFAVGTENGSIQRWSMSKDSAPSLRLHGHDHSCSAIDWHPDGRYLASAGNEKLVKVWDFGLDDRRMKPMKTIRTPQAVTQMHWRPSASSDNVFGSGKPTTNISTTYDARDPRIHVWDLQRPDVPLLELDKYDTPATSLVWHSHDLLWSVGQTGTFTQNDMKLAIKPAQRHGSTIAVNPDGRMAFFSNTRPRYPFPQDPNRRAPDDDSPYQETPPTRNQSFKDLSPDDPATDNTIQKRRQRAAELRSNNSFSSATATEKLEEIKIELMLDIKSMQVCAIGFVPQTFDVQSFVYLANNYKYPSIPFVAGHDAQPYQSIQLAFEENALSAEEVGNVQLAQTWKTLGHSVRNELIKRGDRAKKEKRNSKTEASSTNTKQLSKAAEVKVAHASALAAALKVNDSNASTPLARPSPDHTSMPLHPPEEFNLLATSNSTNQSGEESEQASISASDIAVADDVVRSEKPKGRTIHNDTAVKARNISQKPDESVPYPSFPGHEEAMEERRNQLNSYRARPRTVLNLDHPYGSTQETSGMAPLDRYDSNESFQMFSASVDSDNRSFPMDDSYDERRSISHNSNGSFATSLPSGFPRTKLDELREDDAHLDPLSIEPQNTAEVEELPLIEKTDTRTTIDLVSQDSLARPMLSDTPIIHQNEMIAPEVKPRPTDYLPSDFLNNTKRPDSAKPWSIYSLLRPLLEYHINDLSDTQLPTILMLWLYLYFPSEFERGQITTILLFYHRRLRALQLYSAAAQLRQCSALLFPEIIEYTAGTTPTQLFCRTCRGQLTSSTTTSDQTELRCNTCRSTPATCSVCESHYPPSSLSSTTIPAPGSEQASSKLWSWCQGCGHGGHSSCLYEWFSATNTTSTTSTLLSPAESNEATNPTTSTAISPPETKPTATISEGCCPILGCRHDCTPGPRRDIIVAEQERLRKNARKPVLRDEWIVGESRAVGKARDIVASETLTSMGPVKRVPVATGATAGAGTGMGQRRVRLQINEGEGEGS